MKFAAYGPAEITRGDWANYRLFDRYNRKVASIAILGDDRSGWRPQQFGYELWGTKAGIEFATAKLLDYAADEPAPGSEPKPVCRGSTCAFENARIRPGR